MVCQLCQKKDAVVHFKQVIDGEAREMYICEACATQKGFNVSGNLSISDFLFGVTGQKPKENVLAREERKCPACHMRSSDFRKTSRLGCPTCYRTFAADLAPMIEEMHKGDRHVGKVPRNAEAIREEELRGQLDEAVAAQRFEEAARLRDAIRELEAVAGRERRS